MWGSQESPHVSHTLCCGSVTAQNCDCRTTRGDESPLLNCNGLWDAWKRQSITLRNVSFIADQCILKADQPLNSKLKFPKPNFKKISTMYHALIRAYRQPHTREDRQQRHTRQRRRTEGPSKETREGKIKSRNQCHVLTLQKEHPVFTRHGTSWALDQRWVC